MGFDKHIGNNQSLIMKQYKAVSSLRNLNEAADRIEIDYSTLDTVTKGELKDTIANTLHKFLDLELPEETKTYIRSVIKQNMTYKVDIDYAKIDNEQEMTAFLLKKNIQQVLASRKHSIYTSMTLNANY